MTFVRGWRWPEVKKTDSDVRCKRRQGERESIAEDRVEGWKCECGGEEGSEARRRTGEKGRTDGDAAIKIQIYFTQVK
jgi:hypothetical protein